MDGIKIIAGIGALSGFLALEWMLAASGIVALSWVPLSSLFVLWRMERLPFTPRMAYAAFAGFVLDALLTRPFGASIALFLLIAGVMEILHAVLSRHDSGVARIVNSAFLLILLFILSPLVERMIRYVV